MATSDGDKTAALAATHFASLHEFLLPHLEALSRGHGQSKQRAIASDKLSRLTMAQFLELSTDVYDELQRRTTGAVHPFLPVNPDFHPKRNQARQKLAVLPLSRFRDLASDVHYEIENRFPSVTQEIRQKTSAAQSQQQPLPPPPLSAPAQPSLPNPPLKNPTGPASAGAGLMTTPLEQTHQRIPSPNNHSGSSAQNPAYTLAPVSSQDSLGSRTQPPQADPMRQKNGTPVPGLNNTQGYHRAVASESKATLDNVMVDLGSIMGGADGGEESSKLLIQALQTRIAELKRELETERAGRAAAVSTALSNAASTSDAALRREQARVQDLEKQIFELNSKHQRLQQDFSNLQEDYNEQQQIAGDIRTEATNLLGEIKSLSKRNDELKAQMTPLQDTVDQLQEDNSRIKEDSRRLQEENAQLQDDNRHLIDENKQLQDEVRQIQSENQQIQQENHDLHDQNQQLRDQLRQLMDENRRLQNDPSRSQAMPPMNASNSLSVNADQRSGSSMPASAQPATSPYGIQVVPNGPPSQPPPQTNLLVPQTPRGHHPRPRSNPNIDYEVDDIVDAGIVLMENIDAFHNAVDGLMHAARSETPTNVLVAMKGVVIACKNITSDSEDYENNPECALTDRERNEIVDVKTQLSSALRNQMSVAKDFATNYNSNSVSSLERATCELTATIVALLHVFQRHTGLSNPLEEDDHLGGAVSESFQSRTNEGKVNNSTAQNPPASTQAPSVNTAQSDGSNAHSGGRGVADIMTPTSNYSPNGSNNDNAPNDALAINPENEIEGLKIYLERQTDLIVQAIQTLLYAMRQSTTYGQEFKDTVASITNIVDNLVRVSKQTLGRPAGASFRDRGDTILRELASASIRLDDLGTSMINSPQSKTIKQKLASSSYEIAKFVKELISLIE